MAVEHVRQIRIEHIQPDHVAAERKSRPGGCLQPVQAPVVQVHGERQCSPVGVRGCVGQGHVAQPRGERQPLRMFGGNREEHCAVAFRAVGGADPRVRGEVTVRPEILVQQGLIDFDTQSG
ncbi:MAG: hypothetical protein LC667_05915 [Thioalkalivibrio sp.]|nr:hypothetical protein [Thioalkalivibrio sp.]